MKHGQIYRSVELSKLSDADLSKLEAIFYLQPSYFDAMMLEIDERYGPFETYLENGLGLGPSDRRSLGKLLTH